LAELQQTVVSRIDRVESKFDNGSFSKIYLRPPGSSDRLSGFCNAHAAQRRCLDRAAGTSGSHAPECNRASKRSGSRANRAAIVAAMNDPLAVRCLPGNDADMMRPDHHDADSGAAGIHAFVRPGARKRQTAIRFAKILAQVTAAPAVRPVTVMPVLRARIRFDGKENTRTEATARGFNMGYSTNAHGWRDKRAANSGRSG
jgi:hypothetical protein